MARDKEILQTIEDTVVDNYIEKIYQDLQEGDKSLLTYLLTGQGIKPISDLTNDELIIEAKELGIL